MPMRSGTTLIQKSIIATALSDHIAVLNREHNHDDPIDNLEDEIEHPEQIIIVNYFHKLL